MTLLVILKYDFFIFDIFSIVALEKSIVLLTEQYDAKNIHIKFLLIGIEIGSFIKTTQLGDKFSSIPRDQSFITDPRHVSEI
jgi:hypothetical protein